MNAVLIGATRGMGRALGRELATRGASLALLGRDTRELERSAHDFALRGAKHVAIGTLELAAPEGFESALAAAENSLGALDAVIITAGLFASQDALEADPKALRQLLDADFTNTILLCEAARKRLLSRGAGTLCVFSSVAGDRARRPIVLYGAAKAGLSHYLTGLDHRYRCAGLRTVTVKPGFVRTGMTEGLRPPPFAGDPEAVAKIVVRALERGTPVVYAPGMWRWVMAVIRLLPRAIMRRVEF